MGKVYGRETRFGTMGDAVNRGNWDEFCKWTTKERALALSPIGKRVHTGRACEVCNQDGWNPFFHEGLHPTELTYTQSKYGDESDACSVEWLDNSETCKILAHMRRRADDF